MDLVAESWQKANLKDWPSESLILGYLPIWREKETNV
jgi:hypothetical protein